MTSLRLFFVLICLIPSVALLGSSPTLSTPEEFAKAILDATSNEEQDQIVEANRNQIKPEWIKVLFDQADGMRKKGEYEKAIHTFEAMYRISEKLGFKKEMAKSICQNGHIQYLLSRYDEAESFGRRGISIAESLDDKRTLCSCYSNLGLVQGAQGNYDVGLEYLQKSLGYAEEIKEEQFIALALSNIGYLHFSKGDYREALDKFKQVEKIDRKMNDTVRQGEALNNIGAAYENLGHYRMALEYYQQSLELKEAADNKPGIASTLQNIGLVYLLQGYYEVALEYNQRSQKLYETLGNKRTLANNMVESANIYREMGRLDTALRKYEAALSIAKEISAKEEVGESLNEIGQIYLQQGKIKSALDTFNESLAVHTEMNDREGMASNLMNIGIVHFKNGDYQRSLEFEQQAASVFSEIGKRQLSQRALTEIGLVNMKLQNPDEASRNFDAAISEIESLRSEAFGGEQEQKGFLEQRLKPYQLASILQIKQHDNAQALLYAERARSRVILDVLHGEKPDFSKIMTLEEQTEDKKWNQRLQSLNTELLNARQKESEDSKKLIGLTSQLQKVRFEYESFRSKLYIVHPTLKKQTGETDPLKISEVQSLVDPQTAFLEYLVTDDAAYGFVLTSSGSEAVDIHVFPIPITREKLSAKIASFRKKIAERNLLFQDDAQILYDLLIKPASQNLKTKKNLIVIPDHSLWELPFQVLVSSSSRYLIQDHAISYAPSITVLREMKKLYQDRNNSQQTLLALGNPSIGNEMFHKMNSLYRDNLLGPLPEAEREVKSLGDLYGSKQASVLVGSEALEESIKNKSQQYQILHFATHGVFDNASPLYSYLALAQSPGGSEDGLLEAREIMNLNLHAKLAILSACETARGRIGSGEGVIGLSWALFVAGIPGIIVSQWKVDSASTTELMVEFHRNLRRNMTPVIALQQAELKILQSKQYRHPFYWAGFVPVGNTN